jgi:two-component system sensor kinase FixL
VGRAFSDFVPAFDANVTSSVRQAGVVEAPPDGHWPVLRIDGAKAPITIHAGVLPDDMTPEHLVLSLSDQRQSEFARDRVRDIQAQLNQVWRLNSMGQMAATLAHELNQPLTAATVYLHAGQSDLAQSGPLGDSAGRSLELAKAQLLRAGHIIRRMRDLISSGSRTFAEESVASMIDDLAPVFSLISRDTDVPIRIDIHDADDDVVADRIQIQQAVTNLVRNGVDAVSEQRNGIISLVGRSLGAEGYEIIVEDNGPGIAEIDMDRIFQPLTTSKAGGMGLGLSVTRSIVESHGSQLVVGRSPLGGAAFSFRLPRFTEAEAP